MTLSITTNAITSDVTSHTARRISADNQPGSPNRWRVSWLPSKSLTRNEAITALTIAETVVRWPNLTRESRIWTLVDSWSAELGLVTREAVRVAVLPPQAWDISR